jgi:hypothetical protein
MAAGQSEALINNTTAILLISRLSADLQVRQMPTAVIGFGNPRRFHKCRTNHDLRKISAGMGEVVVNSVMTFVDPIIVARIQRSRWSGIGRCDKRSDHSVHGLRKPWARDGDGVFFFLDRMGIASRAIYPAGSSCACLD